MAADRGRVRFDVRTLGRIFAALLGLPMLVLGAFGLASAYLPDSALLQPMRDGLQAGLSALADAGAPFSYDTAAILEEAVAGVPLRFALAPGGLLLLLLAVVFPFGGGGAERERAERREQNDA